MFKNYLQLMLRLSIFVFSLNALSQTPPTITGSGTATSAICSGYGTISVNTTTSAAPYNLVNSDLSGLPAGATVGGVNHMPTFTSGNPHYVLLTPPSNDKRGFITFAETALKPVSFIATFGLYVGNGNGADGTSFNYGKVNTTNNIYGEAGMIDSGLAIGFHDYTNKIKVYYNNVELQSYNVNGTLNNSNWKSVSIEITGSGQLTLSYGGYTYCTNYQLPAAYVTDNKTNWQYGFAARCGGLNNLHAINDVVIKDRTSWEYSVDGTHYNTTSTFSNLSAGTYDVYARIGDAAYNANYDTTKHFGTSTITGLSVAATLTPTNPTTCTATGTIAISNVTHNFVPYDLINLPLTNSQGGGASFGGLGTSFNPYWGNGDLVLTSNTNNIAGYIDFGNITAQPNAFSANYDVFVGGGSGADGISFNYGNLNTAGTAGTPAEAGMVNSGLAIGFSEVSNTIKIYYNKNVVQTYNVSGLQANSYKSVSLSVTQSGQLTLVWDGTTICSNYQLPAAYASDNKSSWHYAMAARCGLSNNYHSIKNVVIKDNDVQFMIDDSIYTSATTFTGLATGQHTVYARQSNGSHCPAQANLGTATITYTPDITATVAATSPTTCTTEGGTITISNVSPGLSSPYDLVNVSLTNNQLGGATVGGLGTSHTPFFGNGDLVITPPTSNKAGYIAFATTVAQPNAFSANYDVFVGGGNGGDGLSFNYGVLNTSGSLGAAESGMVNSGLAIGFSEYSNTIKIYYNTTELQSYSATVSGGSYKSVAITVTQNGKLTLVYGGTTICSDYQLPAAYATDNKSNWHYALAARCGASNNYHSVKNVVIKDTSIQYTINDVNFTENPNFTNVSPGTYNVRARISNGVHCSSLSTLGSATIAPPPGMVAITSQPASANQSVAQNATATTLSVTATGEATISYQWYSNTTANNSGGSIITNGNSASYTPQTSTTGTMYYYCLLSNACSEVISALSGSVTTYVVAPSISYTTPVTCIVNTPISPLTPTNTGGNPVGVLNHVSTLAGNGSIGSTDGSGNAASFNGPQQLAVDSSGNIYVADQFNAKIRKITPSGVVSTVATNTSFSDPAGVAVDAAGNLYISDTYNNRIVKITTAGVVSTLAGSGSEGNSDGYGSAASFKWPNQLTLDKHNNIYLADAGNNSVRKITPAGLVTTVASIPLAPEALVVDDADNVYVVNNGNNVYKITSGGVVSIFAGSSAPGSEDATGTAASFNTPYGINLDINGNFFVGDYGNNKIRKITPNGVVTTFAGGSTSSSVDGSLTTAGFSGPTGIAFDAQGKMYVADYTGNKIRVISGAAYTITPALPAGLSMDANTGIISGTPMAASSATDYVVTASNAGGSSSFTISIRVLANTPIPTAVSQTFCNGATVADLVATGTNIKWYAAQSGGTVLAASTVLATGTYYASQTLNDIESWNRADVHVTVNTTAAPNAVAQTFCNGSTVDDLLTTTGTALKWYANETGGTQLSWSTVLSTGTYYVSQTLNSCVSARTSVAVTVNTTSAPTASAQTFSGNPTVANLVATGTNLKWYTAATGGTALATSTAIATGTYYVSQTETSCESSRTSVAVTLNITPAPTASAQTFCSGKTVADLVATGTDLKWYAVVTNGTALASTTVLVSGNYFVSQTVSGSESARTSVAVTITPNTSNTTTEAACDTYTWPINGTTYTTSGSYTSVTGCHTETLNLTITPSTSNTTSATGCDSYTWSVNGTTYTDSGTYTSVAGCHTEILNLRLANTSIFRLSMAITTYGDVDSPGGEQYFNIIDNDVNTKFLDWNSSDGTGFTVDLGGVSKIATSISVTTANDAEGRDPKNYEVLGSNDGTNFISIATGVIECNSNRFNTRNYNFVNNTAYGYYRINFTNMCSEGSMFQLAEVQLYATSTNGLSGPIVFTTQPVNTSICNKYGTINLTAAIVPIAGATYQWKVQTATGTTWENANNSSVYYSGATTPVLNIQQATALMNNNKYKLVVTAPTSCTSVVTSDICVLTVNPIPTLALISGAGTICENSAKTLRITHTIVGSVQWQVSTESTTTGFRDIQGATGNTYTTDALTATNYYRVVITSGVCASKTSLAVAVTVIPAPVVGIISGGNVTVCAYATSGLDLSGTSVPFSNNTLLSVAGTTGAIQWQKSTNYENATGATPVWTSALSTTNELTVTNLTADTWYRVLVSNSACSVPSTPVKITVSKLARAGVINSYSNGIVNSASICIGGDITFTSTAYTGSEIKWEVSTTSSTSGFEPIAYANGPTLTMNTEAYAPLTSFYVRSVVRSGDCSIAISGFRKITVSPQSVAGTVTGGGTICPGANGTVKVAGYTGAIQWQSSTDGTNYVNVPTGSATSATYSATNITADTYFRAKITSGICSEVYSNAVQYSIGTASAGTLTAANETVCKGTGTTLTLNQSVGTIKWWKSINWTVATPTWTAVTSTTPTVLTGNLTVSTAYKAEVTIGTCSIETSQVVPVIVIAAPLAKTITANVTSPTGVSSTLAICTTSTSKVLTIGAESVGAIQWQRSSTSSTSGFVDIADATATSYTVTNPTVGANYFRAKYTNSCGTSVFGTAFRVYYKECTPTKAIASSEFGKTPFAVVSHPNPFTNNFNLDVKTSSSEKVSVVVYDMIGRLLEKHQENVSEINTLEIGSNYPAGVYNIIVTQGMEVKTVRVIKK